MPPPSKPIWKSKTLWFNVLSVAGAVTGIVPITATTTIASAVINAGLRTITDKPVTLMGDDGL